MDITVCIPTIPPRVQMLSRAVKSAINQTRPPEAISVALDNEHEGAWITRTRAVKSASTEWVALLDDDDYLYPNHLDVLAREAEESKADYLFSWFDVVGGVDPLGHFGKVWNPEVPTQTTTTILVRRQLVLDVGGWKLPEPGQLIGRQIAGEDFFFTLACRDAGARILHVPERTWAYVHHGENTSGMPDRW